VPLRRVARSAREAWEVPRDLVLGRYPDFVTGGPLARGDVPVFVFHGAEPEPFRRKLQHLADNGYATLSADEYVTVLLGGRPAPDRAVVLTFDDGRGSLWTVAGPLLRAFGMKGVVFLVPGRMRSRPGPLPPTWADVEAARAEASVVLAREQGDGALLSWEEVEALGRIGVFEFQSHTLTHARIHTGPRLAGFVSPASRRGYDAFDQPLVNDGHRDLLGEEVPLGTPLFRSASRTSEELRFFEDPEVRRACVETVAAEGEGFFVRDDWERRLRGIFGSMPVRGRIETPDERTRAIRKELVEARRLIEEWTGRSVVHVCYPWHVAGPTTRCLAREAGYRSAFSGKVPGVPITGVGGDLESIARISGDYVELLPGRGRSTLTEVLRHKWNRRFGRGA
jgi:peptidoglycan/xylan/chitin deacetylase (PgdA/CDA1 family)